MLSFLYSNGILEGVHFSFCLQATLTVTAVLGDVNDNSPVWRNVPSAAISLPEVSDTCELFNYIIL